MAFVSRFFTGSTREVRFEAATALGQAALITSSIAAPGQRHLSHSTTAGPPLGRDGNDGKDSHGSSGSGSSGSSSGGSSSSGRCSSSSSSSSSSDGSHSGFADGSTLPPTRTLPIPLSQDEALLQALCVGHPFIGGASDDTSGEGSGISAVPERPWIKGKGEAEACRARLNRIEEEAHSEVGCWRVLLTRGGRCGTGTKAVGIGIAEYFEV